MAILLHSALFTSIDLDLFVAINTRPLPEREKSGLFDTMFMYQIHFKEYCQGRIIESNPLERQS